jgi:hypothetical protein
VETVDVEAEVVSGLVMTVSSAVTDEGEDVAGVVTLKLGRRRLRFICLVVYVDYIFQSLILYIYFCSEKITQTWSFDSEKILVRP